MNPDTRAARERILARIRAAVSGRTDRRPLPDYPVDVAVPRGAGAGDRLARFSERMTLAHGRVFLDAAALGVWLRAEGAMHGYCDPALAPTVVAALGEGFTVETTFARARVDDYQFGITRAAGAIAETGSLILDDATTTTRLGALAPWIHVAVLDAGQIHEHIADALGALGDDPNVIWCTGPSKTADVEGIMIQGVHGPGQQAALIVPPPPGRL